MNSAVDPWTPSPAVRTVVRTCIGCRQRAPATELLRVVVAPGRSSASSWLIDPDPYRRAPGRGAWVHPQPDCVRLAERRRAYARALRVSGALDLSPLVSFVSPLDVPTCTTV